MNAAKHAQKLKQIRKIKAALRYHEAQKKRSLEEGKKRSLVKDYEARVQAFERSHKAAIHQAINNAEEDWKRGNLRPHRAGGTRTEEYGALSPQQLRNAMRFPEHWYGIDKESPRKSNTFHIPDAIRLDQWPIVRGDRVVVMQGPDAGKIGTVHEYRKEDHTITVDDLNMGYTETTGMEHFEDQQLQPKTQAPISLDYAAVRLVIPKVFERTIGDRTIKEKRDVIVEDIVMEKHTSGKDPFTGEMVAEIPEEHQVDPATGNPIWHRYIAGTREPIPWPWELEPQDEDDVPTVQIPEKKKSLLEKANPLTWFGKGKKDEAVAEPSSANAAKEEKYDSKEMARGEPKAYEPPDFDDDTTRNYVEEETFVPTLVYMPLPPTVLHELNLSPMYLREHGLDGITEERRAATQAAKAAKEREQQARIEALERMKTPMQIRYERMQAQKIKYDPRSPSPPQAQLLAALGKHIAAKKANGESKKVRELAA